MDQGLGGSVLQFLHISGGFHAILTDGTVRRWNGTAWVPAFVDPSIFVLRIAEVAGQFYATCSTPQRGPLKWNGTRWESMITSGTNGPVTQIEAADGVFYVAGNFTRLDDLPANFVARRVGSTWEPMGGGFYAAPAHLLAHAGTVIASGTNLLGSGSAKYAIWNGSTWQTMPGSPPAVPMKLVSRASDAFAMGRFESANAYESMYRWDGNTWAAVPNSSLPSTRIQDIDVDDSGTLLGLMHARWNPTNVQDSSEYWVIGRWDGTAWVSAQARLSGTMTQVVAAFGKVFATGDAWDPITGERSLLWSWSDDHWTPVHVTYFSNLPTQTPPRFTKTNGLLVARGSFEEIASVKAWGLACFDGRSWRPWTEGLVVDPYYGTSSGDLAAMDGELLAISPGRVIGATDLSGFLELRTGALLSAPGVVGAPGDVRARPGQTVRLSVQSDDADSIQWQLGSTALNDGDTLSSMTFSGTHSPVLTIQNSNPNQFGTLRLSAILSNACGQTTTGSARLISNPACPADLAGRWGTPDSAVEFYDLLFFLDHFSLSDMNADLDDGSMLGTTDQSVDINDLLYFLSHFEAGC